MAGSTTLQCLQSPVSDAERAVELSLLHTVKRDNERTARFGPATNGVSSALNMASYANCDSDSYSQASMPRSTRRHATENESIALAGTGSQCSVVEFMTAAAPLGEIVIATAA